jgi:hypothetical protein
LRDILSRPRKRLIKIVPNSKNCEMFLLFFGPTLMLMSYLLHLLLPPQFAVQVIFVSLIGVVVLLLGLVKLVEPRFSYYLCPQGLIYRHRCGQWQISWLEISRIGQLQTYVANQYTDLPYIGLKLHDLESVARNISPRLANKLIHEQNELLLLAVGNNEIKSADAVINFEPYHLNGIEYKGPIAGWLYKTEQLFKAYGYHIYLPENSFDREAREFMRLLKQCQHYVKMNG